MSERAKLWVRQALTVWLAVTVVLTDHTIVEALFAGLLAGNLMVYRWLEHEHTTHATGLTKRVRLR